jgi:hypothetical protein
MARSTGHEPKRCKIPKPFEAGNIDPADETMVAPLCGPMICRATPSKLQVFGMTTN